MKQMIVLGVLAVAGISIQGCAGGSAQQAAVADVVATAEGEPRLVHGAMLSARAEHQATHLGGDLVLVTGGVTLEGTASDTAEVIDTRAANRRALPDRMTTPRAGHAAVALPDGSVLLVGGRDEQGQSLASAERWDPATGVFSLFRDALATPRGRVAVAVTGERAVFASDDSLEVWDLQRVVRLRELRGLGGPRPDGQLVVTSPGFVLYYGGAAEPVLVDVERGQVTAYPGPFHEAATLVGANVAGPELFVVGGRSGGRPVLRPQRVDLLRGGAPDLAALVLAPVDRPAVLARGRRVFVAGGTRGGQPVGDVQFFGADGAGRITPLAGPRQGVVATGLTAARGLFSGGYGPDGRPTALMEILTTDDLEATDAFQHALLAREDLERRLAELDVLRRERDQAQAELTRLQGEITRLQGELSTQRDENARLTAERDRLAGQLAQLTAQRDQLTAQAAEVQRLRDAIVSLEQAVASGNQRASDLRAQLANAAAQAAAQQPVAAGQGQLPAGGGVPAITRTAPSITLTPTGATVPLAGGLSIQRGVIWGTVGPGSIKVELQYTTDGGRHWWPFLQNGSANGITNNTPTARATDPTRFALRGVATSSKFSAITSNVLVPN